jgi:hypothetical protein
MESSGPSSSGTFPMLGGRDTECEELWLGVGVVIGLGGETMRAGAGAACGRLGEAMWEGERKY